MGVAVAVCVGNAVVVGVEVGIAVVVEVGEGVAFAVKVGDSQDRQHSICCLKFYEGMWWQGKKFRMC